jgi:hypothetical protein
MFSCDYVDDARAPVELTRNFRCSPWTKPHRKPVREDIRPRNVLDNIIYLYDNKTHA